MRIYDYIYRFRMAFEASGNSLPAVATFARMKIAMWLQMLCSTSWSKLSSAPTCIACSSCRISDRSCCRA